MARYINIDLTDDEILNKVQAETFDSDTFIVVRKILNSFPTEDVEKVKRARFISELVKKPDWKGQMQDYYQPNSCSNCHTALYGNEKYCSNCGAKMYEKDEDSKRQCLLKALNKTREENYND